MISLRARIAPHSTHRPRIEWRVENLLQSARAVRRGRQSQTEFPLRPWGWIDSRGCSGHRGRRKNRSAQVASVSLLIRAVESDNRAAIHECLS
jgi:hypothetical protein